VKRLVDIAGSLVGLVFTTPLLLFVSLLVMLFLGRPVLFKQWRPGLKNQEFEMIKFRTMREAYDASGQPLSDEQHITRIGSFLRKTSLDELPELWNVLKGGRAQGKSTLPPNLPDEA